MKPGDKLILRGTVGVDGTVWLDNVTNGQTGFPASYPWEHDDRDEYVESDWYLVDGGATTKPTAIHPALERLYRRKPPTPTPCTHEFQENRECNLIRCGICRQYWVPA